MGGNDSVIKLYGLRNCDTCRKVQKTLTANGLAVNLIDVRATPLGRQDLERFFDHFGSKLVNMRSTTWRNLSETDRDLDPVTLLELHPSVMKRPVLEGENGLFLGWDKTVQAQFSG